MEDRGGADSLARSSAQIISVLLGFVPFFASGLSKLQAFEASGWDCSVIYCGQLPRKLPLSEVRVCWNRGYMALSSLSSVKWKSGASHRYRRIVLTRARQDSALRVL